VLIAVDTNIMIRLAMRVLKECMKKLNRKYFQQNAISDSTFGFKKFKHNR
jgi:hypothetical protein